MKLGRSTTQGLLFCWFYILKKYYKRVFQWIFLIFRDKWNGVKVSLQKFPWKPTVYRKSGVILPGVSWCVINFVNLTTLTFQCDFKCKTCLANMTFDHRNLIREESSYTMTWYEEKNGSQTPMTFSKHKHKLPSKNFPFGGTVYKICMLCMFRCADTIFLWKWLKMDVGKSKAVGPEIKDVTCPRKT